MFQKGNASGGMGDDKVNPAPQGAAEKGPGKAVDKKQVEHVLRDELAGLSGSIKGGVTAETREQLERNIEQGPVGKFITGIFGKNNAVSAFLTTIGSWVLGRATFGLYKGEKSIPWEDFEKALSTAEGVAKDKPFSLEEFMVDHRAISGGKGENSLESIERSLENGEKQLEIDLRLGSDGEVYLCHDAIKTNDPAKKHPTLKQALEVFAKHQNQDAAIFFDIKEPAVLDKLDQAISEIDAANRGAENYRLIKDRHFIIGADAEMLISAKEKDPNRPVMFTYFPMVKLKGAGQMLNAVSHKEVESVCKRINKLTGTETIKDVDRYRIHIDGANLEGTNKESTEVVNIYSELPNYTYTDANGKKNHILDVVDYVAMPAVLANEDLIRKLHERGVKVALWGVRKDSEVQHAIGILRADLIISDNPDVIKGKPKNVKPQGK